jgi:arylsulfatase A-like enzyme
LKTFTSFHHARTYKHFRAITRRLNKEPSMAGADLLDPALRDLYWFAGDEDHFSEIRHQLTREVIDKYTPDAIWFDGGGGKYGTEVLLKHYFEVGEAAGKEVVVHNKGNFPENFGVYSYENGHERPLYVDWPWEDDTPSATGWCDWPWFKAIEYKQPRDIVVRLCDLVARNGGLLLSMNPRPDGTLDQGQIDLLEGIGKWLGQNGEAIYATVPWKIFAEGNSGRLEYHQYREDGTPSRGIQPDPQQLNWQDVRFTRNGESLYATVLGVPPAGVVSIRSLATSTSVSASNRIKSVELLGHGPVEWKRGAEALEILLPGTLPNEWALAFRILVEGSRPDQPVKKILIIMTAFMALACHGRDDRPNIILMMADDLGYGDTGFNGNSLIQTPHLDRMADAGAKLTHFYAGGPVCSPTRGTCLTGRHYFRYGIWSANVGHLPKEEITLARMLKQQGYTTGHFGKWHLGTLSPTHSPKGPKRRPAENFAPPWERDYDRSFVVESSVSTWDPGSDKNPFYDDGVPLAGSDDSLLGGSARVVVDRVIPFMEAAVRGETPFLAVVWFNAPHEPIKAGPDYLARYEGHGEAAHYYGCITEMDEQIGRIREALREWDVAENTLVFFCSDNGPEGKEPEGRKAGQTGGLRGRKRSLYDGGVRVPALVEWPGHIEPGSVIRTPFSTLDYFPTVAQLTGFEMPDDRPIDGQDILPILTGATDQREKAIPFRSKGTATIVKDGYKLVLPKAELYDLSQDWAEQHNIAAAHSDRVSDMSRELLEYLESMRKSHAGEDYGDPAYQPLDPWSRFKGGK